MTIIVHHSTPAVETSIEYCPTTKRYIARAHGFVIDAEWTQYQADIALDAWLAVYEATRAIKIPRPVNGVAAIAAAIQRLTGDASIVWHITSLRVPCHPADGTRYAAIITEDTTVELWALSDDGRLATLESVFVDIPAPPASTASAPSSLRTAAAGNPGLLPAAPTTREAA